MDRASRPASQGADRAGRGDPVASALLFSEGSADLKKDAFPVLDSFPTMLGVTSANPSSSKGIWTTRTSRCEDRWSTT
jgi:hypothetical protein